MLTRTLGPLFAVLLGRDIAVKTRQVLSILGPEGRRGMVHEMVLVLVTSTAVAFGSYGGTPKSMTRSSS